MPTDGTLVDDGTICHLVPAAKAVACVSPPVEDLLYFQCDLIIQFFFIKKLLKYNRHYLVHFCWIYIIYLFFVSLYFLFKLLFFQFGEILFLFCPNYDF